MTTPTEPFDFEFFVNFHGASASTVEINGYRLRGFRQYLEITPLADAGKRGKLVETTSVGDWRMDAGEWANLLIAMNEIAVDADFVANVTALAT